MVVPSLQLSRSIQVCWFVAVVAKLANASQQIVAADA
jgi:hypothetical protein